MSQELAERSATSRAVNASTVVTFPSGALTGEARVLAVQPLGDRLGVVCEATPFHPVDHTWPDQPADHGVLAVDGTEYRVTDCLTGGIEVGTGAWYTGTEIPVRRGTADWHWLVVHVVDDAPRIAVGQPVRLVVDAERRAALSAGHTGCELVTLAINEALADRWRKTVRVDVLGHPDFDGLAITSSRIIERGSVDEYRVGKSLRRKGFDAEGLRADLASISQLINARLREWVAEDAPVRVDAEGPGLPDRRLLRLGFRAGEVRVPCGGTHVASTGQLGRTSVSLALSEDGTALSMRTIVDDGGRN